MQIRVSIPLRTAYVKEKTALQKHADRLKKRKVRSQIGKVELKPGDLKPYNFG